MKKLLFTLFALFLLGTTQAQVYPGIQATPIIESEGGFSFDVPEIIPLIGKVTWDEFRQMGAPNTPTITMEYDEGEYDVEIYDSRYKVWREVRIYFKPENGGKMQSFSYYDPYPTGYITFTAVWKDSKGVKFKTISTRVDPFGRHRVEVRYKNVRVIVDEERCRVAFSHISQ